MSIPAAFAEKSLVTIHHMTELLPHVQDVDEKTLVLFDIDSTLTTCSDPDLRRYAIKTHKKLYTNLVSPLSPEQLYYFTHLLVAHSPSQLIDVETPAIVTQVQGKGAVVLACTSSKTGGVGAFIEDYPQWRYGQLKKVGIDFSKAFPGKIIFFQLPDFDENHPGMEKGIVYCGHLLQKGDVLKAVLDTLKIQPKKIIAIDDKLANLESLEQAAKNHLPGVEFLKIHYLGIEIIKPIPTEARVFQEKVEHLLEKTKTIIP